MLDRTRPFSTVYGIADHAFSQDGKQFDRDGKEVGAAKPVKAVKAAKAADAPAAPDDQVSAQLEG